MNLPGTALLTTIKIDLPHDGTFEDIEHTIVQSDQTSDFARSHEELLAFSSFAVLHSVLAGVSPVYGIQVCDWYLSVMNNRTPETADDWRKSSLTGWTIRLREAESLMDLQSDPFFAGRGISALAANGEYIQFAEIFAEYTGDLIDDERLLQRFSCVQLEMIAFYLKHGVIQSIADEKVDLIGLGQVVTKKMNAYAQQLTQMWDDDSLMVCAKTFRKHLKQADRFLSDAKRLCGIRQAQTAKRF